MCIDLLDFRSAFSLNRLIFDNVILTKKSCDVCVSLLLCVNAWFCVFVESNCVFYVCNFTKMCNFVTLKKCNCDVQRATLGGIL